MGFLKVKKINRPEDNFEMEYLDRGNAVAAVIFNSDYSQILLTKQYRPGAGKEIYEIPAGMIDGNETPEQAIIREIREETGYDVNDIDYLIPLTEGFVSPGSSTEKIFLYTTRVLINAKQKELQLDANEKLTLEWKTIEEAKTLCQDYKTLLGLSMALSRPKLKIGVFGGTFNPITYLHLLTMERAVEEMNLDMCIVEPVGDNYIKQGIINKHHRLNMIELAIDDNEKIKLGKFEVNEFIQPQTIQTLNHYKEKYGWCEIYFICGSDILKDSEHWSNITKLLENFNIICIQRNNDNVYNDIILRSNIFIKYKNKINIIYENVTNDISSSKIRNLIKANSSIKYLLPESVRNYIKINQLYN